jgi:hypothetical protein
MAPFAFEVDVPILDYGNTRHQGRFVDDTLVAGPTKLVSLTVCIG